MRNPFLVLSLLSAVAALLATPSTHAQFTATDIGNPAIAGSSTPSGNGYAVTGSGADIFGASDQFHFNSASYTGDFDVKLRVQSYSASSVWAKAGLMARETFATNSRHASVLATPSLSGTFFASRIALGGQTTNAGSFPVGYPSTWLRLKRAGATFTGYASLDGQAWAQLGSVTLVSPSNTVNVGMAVTSANTTQAATAQFRDFADVVGGTIGNVQLSFEPPGPSSRNTGLVISEIMYHPKPTNDLEFIEILNAGLIEEDLSAYRISGDVDYTFPGGTKLRAGARLVVARYPSRVQTVYGISGVLGPWTGDGASAPTNALPDDEGTIRLRHKAGAVLLEVTYAGQKPWPIGADGAGHSLVLSRASYGEADHRAWSASEQIGGSPGVPDPIVAEPVRTILINEFLAHTDDPVFDYIELYNAGNQPVEIAGLYLSDDRDTNKFRIPPGTPALPARGFVSFDQNTLGFSLSSGGERIYLVNSNQTRVLDAVVFEAQANSVASGRYPDGSPGLQELTNRTPGTANSPKLIRNVVINEIMYHPVTENDDDEYVELYNRSVVAVDVSNWRFTDGIDFRIPANTTIPANGYLVIARSVTNLLAKYPQLNATNTFGNYDGGLGNAGERLALAMPDYFLVTNNNVVLTQANYIVVDEVNYVDTGRWTQWSDGGGSSLELLDPGSDNSLPANWADSDETAKSAWTSVNFKGLIDNVYPVNAAGATHNELQVMILGGGEALMDDVAVHAETTATGPNLVANGTFASGLGGWLNQGNHIKSSLEPAGPNNPTASMRIRASAGGDNGANRNETDLTSTLSANTMASIRAQLRWLRGHRNVLLRLHGGGLEVVTTLPVPNNLGSPGLPNSRLLPNAGPAIYDVSHTPALPAANQPVLITARVSDPDGLGSVVAQYRLDPSATLSSLTLRDDGTGGDALANDGLFTATLPGQNAGTLVAFRIQATDAKPPTGATALFPPDAPTRECLIRFGDPVYSGNLGVYRVWMTAANISEWTTRELLSNEAQDGTFVYNNFRVIYSAAARYRGSPFIRPGYNTPTGNACGYVWILPDDDLFLGQDELNLDSLEPTGRDSTALREVTSFTILEQLGDMPLSYQRFVHVVINGINNTSRGIPIYTDSQQPNSSYIASWFPDNPDGEIYKIDDWFEFTDNPIRMQGNKSASLQNFTTPGPLGPVKKQARYRWSWERKSNRSLDDDYSSLFTMVDALNSPDASYVRAVESIMDAEEWLGTLAFRHVVGDWDGYGYQRGKNQFTYREDGGKFAMLMWDLDFSLGCNGGHGPQQDLFTVSLGGDSGSDHMPEVSRMYNHPHFRRIYLRNLQRMADGPLQNANFLPVLDARYRGLQANGVTTVSPYVGSGAQGISISNWLVQRRVHILGPTGVGAYSNSVFTVSSPLTITTNGNLISITGGAPLLIKDILINGVAWPVTWNTVTSWVARVVLDTGTNTLKISGVDVAGNSITSTQTVTGVYTGPAVAVEGSVIFNEIMYQPTIPEAGFVELLNTSSSSFDLGGWRLNGLDYTFPPGTVLTNGQYLVVARNRGAFTAAFGTNAVAFDEFDGNLDLDGETLTLVKPGAISATDVVIDRVRYEAALPWPDALSLNGSSLQLVDAAQDNSRPSNWDAGFGWQRFTRTGNIVNATNIIFWISAAGNSYLDDISLIGPAGTNILANAGFETGTVAPWILGATYSNSVVVSGISRSGNNSLFLQGSAPGGSFPNNLVQQIITDLVESNSIYTLTFYALYNTNPVTVNMRSLPGNNLTIAGVTAPVQATPGAANLFVANLPDYDPLWLNEVQPDNTAGLADNFGQREPWIEIYNGGSAPLDLSGYYLATNYITGLTQWPFPAGSSIGPGEFRVIWADGQPAQTSGTNLHTSFRLPPTAGSLALVRLVENAPQITDYLTYPAVGPALSYGDYPDGQPFNRVVMFDVTPGATNRARGINVFVNEWMAANSTNSGFADPADGDYDDWFELYNAGSETVDLGGYFLTDDLGNINKFMIPTNGHYQIPPGGFLLVWADGETGQNNTNRADLHADFNLRAAGEALGLFAADGTPIDAINFTNQVNDLSEGRYTDGAPAIYAMTTPTPRAPNTVGGGNNNPPVLSPIANRFISAGQTVAFTASATDPDAGQSRAFSLDPGFPSGAMINSASGQFVWNSPPTQVPGNNSITVRVTDNGIPPASATQTFMVTVAPPASVSITGNTVSLNFPTVPGKTYRIEYKNDLNLATWTPLVTTVAAGTSLPASDTLGANAQRFYRIVQLD